VLQITLLLQGNTAGKVSSQPARGASSWIGTPAITKIKSRLPSIEFPGFDFGPLSELPEIREGLWRAQISNAAEQV